MNFNTYLQTVLLRASPMPGPSQKIHAQVGMLTEIGELGDLFKKEFAYGKPFDAVNLLEECGDLMWYFVLYCYECGIGMPMLDLCMAKANDDLAKGKLDAEEPNEKVFRGLSFTIATLAAPNEMFDLDKDFNARLELVEASFNLIYHFLAKYGFTMEQCLIANDAKLEKRTGKKFDAAAILNRDTAAERVILEAHGQAQPPAAAV